MAKNYTEINQEQRQFGSAYRKASPDTMNAFLALHKAAMREGELSVKGRPIAARHPRFSDPPADMPCRHSSNSAGGAPRSVFP
jgi:hypothetical protein